MGLEVQEIAADYTDLITADQYQEYLRYDGTDQSNILPVMLESAIRTAEMYCNASFGDKTYTVFKDNIESGKKFRLPFPSIREVTEVVSVDSDGTETVITTGFATLGLDKKYMIFDTSGMYMITYTAGNETPSNTPSQVKEAICQILSENWERRDDIVTGTIVAVVGRNSAVKLAPYRVNIL